MWDIDHTRMFELHCKMRKEQCRAMLEESMKEGAIRDALAERVTHTEHHDRVWPLALREGLKQYLARLTDSMTGLFHGPSHT